MLQQTFVLIILDFMKTFKKSSIIAFYFAIFSFLFCLVSCNNSEKKSSDNSEVRIVSLGPAATEIIFFFFAQDQLVARTDLCDYPAEVSEYPSVGGFTGNAISLEAIISYEPTLVYLFAGMHDFLIKPLEDAGIKVYVSDASSIEAVKKEVLDIGELTGHEKQAQKVVKEMDKKLDAAKKLTEKESGKNEENLPTVYWEVWHEPMMSVGKNSFINDIIQYAGGKNIFADEESSYPMVSEEAVLYANPDYIFYTGDGMGGGKPSEVFNPPKGIYYMGDDDGFVRSSPRVADAVEKLSLILWGKN